MDGSDTGSFDEKSVEDLTVSATNSPTHNSPRSGRPFTTRSVIHLMPKAKHTHEIIFIWINCIPVTQKVKVCKVLKTPHATAHNNFYISYELVN